MKLTEMSLAQGEIYLDFFTKFQIPAFLFVSDKTETQSHADASENRVFFYSEKEVFTSTVLMFYIGP